jgi:transcriptional regulator with XRE-family HTH domain
LEALRRIRTLRGMNQVDLAKASGVAQNTISEIELGKRQARPETLKKLADALGVEIASFFKPGEAYFVPSEEGEEPDTITIEIRYVRLLEEENDRLLQRIRALERELKVDKAAQTA